MAEQHLRHLQGQGAAGFQMCRAMGLSPWGEMVWGLVSRDPPAPLFLGLVPGAAVPAGLSPLGTKKPAQSCSALCLLSFPPNNSPLLKNYNFKENWSDSSLHRAVCEELAGVFPPATAALSGGFNLCR